MNDRLCGSNGRKLMSTTSLWNALEAHRCEGENALKRQLLSSWAF